MICPDIDAGLRNAPEVAGRSGICRLWLVAIERCVHLEHRAIRDGLLLRRLRLGHALGYEVAAADDQRHAQRRGNDAGTTPTTTRTRHNLLHLDGRGNNCIASLTKQETNTSTEIGHCRFWSSAHFGTTFLRSERPRLIRDFTVPTRTFITSAISETGRSA